jgi:gliding motility-associated lipoprotein GldD
MRWKYCALVLALFACNSAPVPKPKGYFRIDFPPRGYQRFDQPGYPYSFEYHVYASILKDSTYFEQSPDNPYWINVDFPLFHGRIYLSYINIGTHALYKVKGPSGVYHDSLGVNTFDKLVNDAFNLTNRHSEVASSIDQTPVHPRPDIYGFVFEVGGNAATRYQFFLTDSVRHFIRGALYFDSPPNEDSLRPVNKFLFEDMKHLIGTLQWKGSGGRPPEGQ